MDLTTAKLITFNSSSSREETALCHLFEPLGGPACLENHYRSVIIVHDAAQPQHDGWHNINEDSVPPVHHFSPAYTPGVQPDSHKQHTPLNLFQLFFLIKLQSRVSATT